MTKRQMRKLEKQERMEMYLLSKLLIRGYFHFMPRDKVKISTYASQAKFGMALKERCKLEGARRVQLFLMRDYR